MLIASNRFTRCRSGAYAALSVALDSLEKVEGSQAYLPRAGVEPISRPPGAHLFPG
jgi:hypothetical protein